MAIIADSSLLIGMVKIWRLEILKKLYKQVLIPPTVYREIVVEGRRLHNAGVKEIEIALKEGWIQVIILDKIQMDNAETYKSSSEIAEGEAEALALAQSRRLPIILDDRYARELATTLELEFLGTGAVLLEAYLRRFLSKNEFMESLRELGKVMWLSPEVVAELLRMAGEKRK